MVGRWERGEHTPRPPYPRLLCLLFDASPEALGLSDPEAAVVEELRLVSGRRVERPLRLSWARQPAKSMAAMEQAEALLEKASPDDRPAWFDYYDPARLAGFNSLMHIRLGDPEAAQQILDQAIDALPAEAAKQRACYLADQAAVHANAGEVDRACQLGTDALQILGEVEYATGVQRVRDLRASLRPHRQHPAVADLTEQLLLVS
jgi:tetratricopeptide (TPR) repeat protein